METKWFIDLETVSAVDLTKVKLMNYAKHPSTRITMMGLCKVQEGSDGKTSRRAVLPRAEYRDHITEEAFELFTEFVKTLSTRKSNVCIVAHNYAFDWKIIRHCLKEFAEGHGLSADSILPPWSSGDTSVMARTLGYPGKLDQVSVHLGLTGKDHEGHAIMKATTSGISQEEYDGKKRKQGVVRKLPYEWTKLGDHYYKLSPEIVERLMEYCNRDVRLCTELYYKMKPMWEAVNGEFYDEVSTGIRATAFCNMYGLTIDTELLDKLIEVSDKIEDRLSEVVYDEFWLKGTQKTALLKAINETLSEKALDTLESLDKKHLNEYMWRLANDEMSDNLSEIPENVLRTIAALLKYSKSSLRKMKNLKKMLHNGKLYDYLVFSGAGVTGRWASWGFQIQNLPRPTHTLEEVKRASVEHMVNNPDIAVSAIRALIIPRPEKKMVSIDLKQIEARVSLYKAGHTEYLEDIQQGADPYMHFAVEAKVTRDVAKTAILSLQYGVGSNKFKEMINQGRFNSNEPYFTQEEAERVVKKYRETYHLMPKQWAKYNKMIIEAHKEKKPLIVPLNSGRSLNYGRIKKEMSQGEFGWRPVYVYDTGSFNREIHGAKLYNNVIQAEARDIFLIKFNEMYGSSYVPLFCVHDEVVLSLEEDKAAAAKEYFDEAGDDKLIKHYPGLRVASDMKVGDCYYK